MADIEKSQAPETEFQRTNTLFTTQLSSLSYNIQQENIIKAESIAGISPLKEEIQSKRPTEQQTEKTNTEYTVQKGDTLSKIARSLGADDTTVNELIKYLKIINNKKDDNLKQGEKLVYNKKRVEKIKEGNKISQNPNNADVLRQTENKENTNNPLTENKERFTSGKKYANINGMAEKYETQGDKKITEMYSNIDGNPSMTIVNAKKPQPPLNSGKKITTVEKIVLHSTAGNGFTQKNIENNGAPAQFVIRPNGEILRNFIKGQVVGLTHAGVSQWGDFATEDFTNKSIGIEVETGGGIERTDPQYESLQKLLKWIAKTYKKGNGEELKVSDILTHSQIAYTKPKKSNKENKPFRGRKRDPYYVNWEKLGLPNNYTLFDPNVAMGEFDANLKAIKNERTDGIQKVQKGKDKSYGKTQVTNMTSGLEKSDVISKINGIPQGKKSVPEQPKNSNNIFPTQKSNDNLAMRVYSLNIKYIDAHRDFRKAQGKIENIPKLKEIFNGDFSFEYLLPIFIKETLLTHSNISSSGAIGYGQLTNTAITEIYRQYPSLKLLNLKKENPIDNIILSYIYHKFIVTKYVKNIIQKYNINLTPPEFQYFVHFAYNAGIGTLTELLQKSNAKTLLDFQKYCAKKLGLRYNPKPTNDPVYKINYIDILGGKKKTGIIYDGIRYASVVQGLSQYLQTPRQINSLGEIQVTKEKSLYAQVREARDKQKVFKEKANIDEICTIILESNGFADSEIPIGIPLTINSSLLEEYLNPISFRSINPISFRKK